MSNNKNKLSKNLFCLEINKRMFQHELDKVTEITLKVNHITEFLETLKKNNIKK